MIVHTYLLFVNIVFNQIKSGRFGDVPELTIVCLGWMATSAIFGQC